MTEQPTEPTPDIEPDGDDAPETIEQARKLRSENRALRTRLHDLESEHEGAVTRLAALEHAEVERHAAELLIDPQDIWREQPDLQAYYDEEFQQIVPDRVREAARAIIASRPHLTRPQNTPPPTQRPIEHLRPGARGTETARETSWPQFLRG
jgi:hypothetical protein